VTDQTQPPGDMSNKEATRIGRSAPPHDELTRVVSAPRRAETGAVGGDGVAHPLVGKRINNNYRIDAVLKAGGMGEVFRGSELGTGDPVAIKAILPQYAEDGEIGLMFRREAKILRQLTDDSIVRYFNYVEDPVLDRYFLVMEFIEGISLWDHIRKTGAIEPVAAAALMRRLAGGLAKAHAMEVVHRDLSPDNVMLPGGRIADARLIDFGIARSNVIREGTVMGRFAGKYRYAAPEQVAQAPVVGAPADIYSLALVVCAAVLGEPLDMGISTGNPLAARQKIPDLAEVSPMLRPILSHMLEPDPKARPASMQQVREMLERPELIPARYRSGLPMPAAVEPTRNTTSGSVLDGARRTPVPGLQVPGTTGLGTAVPRRSAQGVDRSPARRFPWLALVLVGAVLAGGGWYLWQRQQVGLSAAETAKTGAAPRAAIPGQGLPPVRVDTREGFLAGFEPTPCTYAARMSSGANAGAIEGFSTDATGFADLPRAFGQVFGSTPSVLGRPVIAAQCPALDLARGLQGRADSPVQLLLSTDRMVSGATLEAVISGSSAAASIWVVLVGPLGGLYNLTNRLGPPDGAQRALSVPLALTRDAVATPHLVLVVETAQPLAIAATMRPGAQASEVLPAVLEAVAAQGGRPSAALGWVLLEPATAP